MNKATDTSALLDPLSFIVPLRGEVYHLHFTNEDTEAHGIKEPAWTHTANA